MISEFGSDFHRCDADFRSTVAKESRVSLMDVYGCTQTYACGRHAIDALVAENGWKRIWIPAYFCYEVIEHIKKTVEVVLYDDYPLQLNDDVVVKALPFRDGDVLLRMNFFGLRGRRTNKGLNVPVIEDHTHDLTSEWALISDADYSIASIRKSMPVAAGGILWSPKGLPLPKRIPSTGECEKMAKVRYEGMELKRNYWRGGCEDVDLKNTFREKFLQTEEMIDNLEISGMDRKSLEIVSEMNVRMWMELKTDNWHIAYTQLKENFQILHPSDQDYWRNPFSLIILCDSAEERTRLRAHLIKNMIYPAILWQVPVDTKFKEALDFSEKMLSVHVDARYSRNDIDEMCQRISDFRHE